MEDLHKFLSSNECHLYLDKQKKVQAFVCIVFSNIPDFVAVMGNCYFDDSGVKVIMRDTYIVVDLLEIIEDAGLGLDDFKECFGEDWDSIWHKPH